MNYINNVLCHHHSNSQDSPSSIEHDGLIRLETGILKAPFDFSSHETYEDYIHHEDR